MNAACTVILACVLLGVAASTTNAIPLYQWQTYNGHQYALTTGPYGTWADAENEAVSAGGHLATINDAQENAWLASTFDFLPTTFAWIGYYQTGSGVWQWISGEPVTYTNLYFMFPQGGTHAYLHLNNIYNVPPGTAGTWNADFTHDTPSHPDYHPTAGIIEVVPEPATLTLLTLGGLALLRRRW